MANENMNIKAINSKELLVYLCLRRHMNKETGEAYVPLAQLVKETGASPVTILICLRNLKDNQHIDYHRQGRCNCYIFKSQIDAYSYDFMDTKLSFIKKAGLAMNQAYVSDNNESLGEQQNSRLYEYVAALETRVIKLQNTLGILVNEINQLRKCTSLIMGKEYTPIELETLKLTE